VTRGGFRVHCVEPVHTLLTQEHGALPLLIAHDFRVRGDREYGVGLRPILTTRLPDPGKIEPVTVGEGEPIAPAALSDVSTNAGSNPEDGTAHVQRLSA
jgi:hypothetical protein